MLKDRERAVKISLISTKTTPALEDAEKLAAPIKTKKEAAAASSSTNDPPKGNPKAEAKSEAASVLPTPSPKSHADKKNKNGKGKGGRSSSPTDKKKIFCNYFSNKGGCNTGDTCLYSHSQKVFDARMKDKKGRSRSRDSSRGKSKRSSSSAGLKMAMAERYLYVRKQMQVSFTQTNHHQRLLNGPAKRPRRRMQPLFPLIPSLTATMKTQWTIPLRG